MSTSRVLSTLEGTMSALGGGGDTMSALEFSIEIERSYQVAPPHAS